MPKRTKAIKKTDRKKPWNRRKESSRQIETDETYKTILIVTEGQTEKLYFESFPVRTDFKVKAVDLKGQSKLNMITATEEMVRRSSIEYDETWCVFDMDVGNNDQEKAQFDNAIKQGHSKGYKIAYSNDCFELWFYLHYAHTEQSHHRTFYYQQLGKKWTCNYEKRGKTQKFAKGIYGRLLNASQQKAIQHAKKLYEQQKNKPPHQQNPVTLVFQLVELLNANLRP